MKNRIVSFLFLVALLAMSLTAFGTELRETMTWVSKNSAGQNVFGELNEDIEIAGQHLIKGACFAKCDSSNCPDIDSSALQGAVDAVDKCVVSGKQSDNGKPYRIIQIPATYSKEVKLQSPINITSNSFGRGEDKDGNMVDIKELIIVADGQTRKAIISDGASEAFKIVNAGVTKTVKIRNMIISGFSQNGFLINNSDVDVYNDSFENNGSGIFIVSGRGTVWGSGFKNNQTGIKYSDQSYLMGFYLMRNIFEDNGKNIELSGEELDPVLGFDFAEYYKIDGQDKYRMTFTFDGPLPSTKMNKKILIYKYDEKGADKDGTVSLAVPIPYIIVVDMSENIPNNCVLDDARKRLECDIAKWSGSESADKLVAQMFWDRYDRSGTTPFSNVIDFGTQRPVEQPAVTVPSEGGEGEEGFLLGRIDLIRKIIEQPKLKEPPTTVPSEGEEGEGEAEGGFLFRRIDLIPKIRIQDNIAGIVKFKVKDLVGDKLGEVVLVPGGTGEPGGTPGEGEGTDEGESLEPGGEGATSSAAGPGGCNCSFVKGDEVAVPWFQLFLIGFALIVPVCLRLFYRKIRN